MEISESRALVPVRSKKTAAQTIIRKRRSSGNGGAGTGRWGTDEPPKSDRQFFRDSMRQMHQWRKTKDGVDTRTGALISAEPLLTSRDLRRSFALGAASAVGVVAALLLVIALLAAGLGWTGPMTILGTCVIFSAVSAGLFIQSVTKDVRIEPSETGASDADSD